MVYFLEWQAVNEDGWHRQMQLMSVSEEYLRVQLEYLRLDGVDVHKGTWRIAAYELSTVTFLVFDLFGEIMLLKDKVV